jgi:hypothetical protein
MTPAAQTRTIATGSRLDADLERPSLRRGPRGFGRSLACTHQHSMGVYQLTIVHAYNYISERSKSELVASTHNDPPGTRPVIDIYRCGPSEFGVLYPAGCRSRPRT